MTGAIFLGLYAVLGGASGVLAWAQVRRVLDVVAEDTTELALGLKRVPAAERAAALRDRAAAGSFAHQLAEELIAAPSDDAKVAAVNLALGEVEHALVQAAAWPRTALRIALLGAGLSAIAAWLADPATARWPLAILGAGALAALTCAQAQRTGERHAARRREAADALVAAVLAFPPEARPAASSGGGGSSARRRRRGD